MAESLVSAVFCCADVVFMLSRYIFAPDTISGAFFCLDQWFLSSVIAFFTAAGTELHGRQAGIFFEL